MKYGINDYVRRGLATVIALVMIFTTMEFTALAGPAIELEVKEGPLETVDTLARLGNLIQEYLEEMNTRIHAQPMIDSMMPPVSTNDLARNMATTSGVMEDSPALGGSDFSTTNVQVQGIDEADIIKTDGRYIYYLRHVQTSNGRGWFNWNAEPELLIVKVDNGYMDVVYRTTFDGFRPREMYVDGDTLILIGQAQGWEVVVDRDRVRQDFVNEARVMYFDIKERHIPEQTRTINVEGHYRNSRKIDNMVYLVTDSHLDIWGGWHTRPVTRTTVDTIEAMLPRIGTVENRQPVPLDTMHIIPDGNFSQLTIVTAINSKSDELKIASMLGASDTVYMSHDNLFLTSQRSRWGFDTEVYRFAIGDGDVKFEARGRVEGYLINQFALDEHKGYLRVATTTGSWGRDRTNGVHVLNRDLEVVGSVKGLAPEERIYSARFMGDRGFIVTFLEVDPLFTFDLSDPYNPKMVGELKIPGYSTYLHPFGPNHLIGIGEETELNRWGWVEQIGMKISLFDVTDMADPQELHVLHIGMAGTTSEALHNHKAILVNPDATMIAFPVMETGYDTEFGVTDAVIALRQGMFVFDVDIEKGFTLRGTAEQITQTEILLAMAYWQLQEQLFDRLITRGVYIGDILYSLSSHAMSAHKLSTLEEIDVMEFNPKIENRRQR
jgi:uncharacterized secreted protein with C-terminal beta-propeller domain